MTDVTQERVRMLHFVVVCVGVIFFLPTVGFCVSFFGTLHQQLDVEV